MSATTPEETKAQPWKTNWTPAKQSSETTGRKYMVLIDGVDPTPPGFFSELACSRQEIEAAKAQPLKSHWSSTEDAPKTSHKYMTDDTGALLIDGSGSGGGGIGGPGGPGGNGFFSELACSQ